ncbi:MAG: HAD hydrolase family protein [Bacteroidetes bacterium]|nr:HAD hydrolase family protein [Bacteroidota bacterium]
MKNLIFDIDKTLTVHQKDIDYIDLPPNQEIIEKLKNYREKGFRIILYTARNMRSFNNNIGEINAKTLPVLFKWLEKHEIPYDEIFVGKPWCGHDGFYIDDKAIRPQEFLDLSYEEIRKLIDA